jgi:hypothetical protein
MSKVSNLDGIDKFFVCGKMEGNAAKFMIHDDICLLFFLLFLMSGQGYSRARTTTERLFLVKFIFISFHLSLDQKQAPECSKNFCRKDK